MSEDVAIITVHDRNVSDVGIRINGPGVAVAVDLDEVAVVVREEASCVAVRFDGPISDVSIMLNERTARIMWGQLGAAIERMTPDPPKPATPEHTS